MGSCGRGERSKIYRVWYVVESEIAGRQVGSASSVREEVDVGVVVGVRCKCTCVFKTGWKGVGVLCRA